MHYGSTTILWPFVLDMQYNSHWQRTKNQNANSEFFCSRRLQIYFYVSNLFSRNPKSNLFKYVKLIWISLPATSTYDYLADYVTPSKYKLNYFSRTKGSGVTSCPHLSQDEECPKTHREITGLFSSLYSFCFNLLPTALTWEVMQSPPSDVCPSVCFHSIFGND